MAKTKTKKRKPAPKKTRPAAKKLLSKRPAAKKPSAKKPPAKKPLRKPRTAQGDGHVRTGIARLGEIIANAKRDLAALQAQEIGRTHLPSAGDELSAIVGATEAATNSILDAVERIQKAAASAAPDVNDAITQDVTAIFEACNFQDITGQRISKIVAVLKEVDKTVAELLATLHMPMAAVPPAAPLARTGDAALLNGPQAPDAAPNQADIDAMFDKA